MLVFIAVIPAMNEAKNLSKVICKLPKDSLDLVIPVLNGCTDNSLLVLGKINCPILAPLCFNDTLGIDIPRAVGIIAASEFKVTGVLFLDGDMHRVSTEVLRKLIRAVRDKGTDLALTNCYPYYVNKNLSAVATCLLRIRDNLNRHLNISDRIGSATPSHGPHAISGRLLKSVNPEDFAVPPRLLLRATLAGLKIEVEAETPHSLLGSSLRSTEHCQNIVETIIGDCLEVLQAKDGQPGNRILNGRKYIGYHNHRRWDLLEGFLKGHIKGDCF